MKNLIAGNWKMNGGVEQASALAKGVVSGIDAQPELLDSCDFVVFPPYLHLTSVQAALTNGIALGAQDCSPFENGAYTGDVSADMLKDLGCEYVILGHSERRSYYVETDLLVKQKASMVHAAGLKAIICVGETEEERESGKEQDVVGEQLANSLPDSATSANTVIAYEPVWAIGTGKTATTDDIRDMHGFIRTQLNRTFSLPRESGDPDGGEEDSRLRGKNSQGNDVRILYGGSVKPGNAAEIFAVENVNGALIGGASLKADDFIGIAAVTKES